MSHKKVVVEWRRGINGENGVYTFSPNPSIRRVSPGKRTAELTVPLLDGFIVQNLGNAHRRIELDGVLLNKNGSWDDMETLRNNLISGLGTGPGQLHIISPSRHIRYDAQVTTDGIQFDRQERVNIQDYTVFLVSPSGKELTVSEITNTITSDGEIV